MSEPNDDKDPARQSEITKIVENSIHVLAKWSSEEDGANEISKDQATKRLPIPGDQYVQVMKALHRDGVIEEINPVSSDPFRQFKILPVAVKRWDAIQSRDRVSQVIGWFRSSPWLAGPILLLLALIAISTGANEGYDFLQHVGIIHEQPTVTLTPVVLPCPAPSPTPVTKIAKYGGQPLEFWETKLNDKDHKEKQEAHDAFLGFGKLAVPTLVKALYADDEETVKVAAQTLGGLGPMAAEAIPNLEKTKETHKSLESTIDDALKKIRGK